MKKITTKQGHYASRFMLTVLFIFLLVGVYFTLRSYQLVSNGIVGYGIIVDNEKSTINCPAGGGVCYAYYPIVEYQTSNGDKYKFTSSASIQDTHSIGGEVKIIYELDKLNQAEIYNFKSLWLLPILLLSFSLLGMVIIFFTRNKKLNNNASFRKAQVQVSMEDGNPKIVAMDPQAEKTARQMRDTVDKYKDLIDKF